MVAALAMQLLFLSPPVAVAKNDSGYTYFQKLTGDDTDSDKLRWDNLYRKNKGYVFGKEPAPFLVDALPVLPLGRALDLAMGEGRNAVYLAKKGFEVVGVDISEVAIRKAQRLSRDSHVHIKTVVADLNKYQIPPMSYDVIIVFYYLQRSLHEQIVRALKPGGVLVYQTYTLDQVKHDPAENRDYLLGKGELKTLFKDLEVVKYEETDDGNEAVASLIARKRK
jgi:SAM-dependent methyltransferase